MADTATTSAPLFGKKERRLLTDPFNDNNPVTVQVLGICSALAVTAALKPSIVMAIAVTFVAAFSNLAISLLSAEEARTVITKGRNLMQAYEDRLSAEEIDAVSRYIQLFKATP